VADHESILKLNRDGMEAKDCKAIKCLSIKLAGGNEMSLSRSS